MIIDDEPYNIEVLKSILSTMDMCGFPDCISCFYDADSALKVLESSISYDTETGDQTSDFCLVLSDLNMPIMDGYDFAVSARDIFNRRQIPRSDQPKIVAVTGNVEHSYIRRCF